MWLPLVLTYPLNPALAEATEDGKKASGAPEGTVNLEKITVTGAAEGYQVLETSTPSRLDIPLRDLPFSVGSVARPVIEDQRTVTVQETFKNVSGVIPVANLTAGQQGVGATIRGFTSGSEFFVNGFRQQGQNALTGPLDIANIDRIDVLKGPAGLLFGAVSSPGGLVNAVTKTPLSAPHFHLAVTPGSFGYIRPEFDVTGPITPDGSLLGRLNFAYTNTDGYIDFNDQQSFFVAPALSWLITEDTRLDVEFNFNNIDEGTATVGFPALDASLRLPVERFLGEPDFKSLSNQTQTWFAKLEHSFNEQWKARLSGNYVHNRENDNSFFVFDFANSPGDCSNEVFDPNGSTACRSPFQQTNDSEQYTMRGEILGEFDTGPIKHKALVGGEYYELKESNGFFRMDPISLSNGADVSFIDINNPVYAQNLQLQQLPLLDPFGMPTFAGFINDGLIQDGAVYFEDFVTLLPNLKIIGGGRYDMVEVQTTDQVSNTTSTQNDDKFSGRAGIVWQPFDPTSLYFSWSESFFPQSGVTLSGSPLAPETGEGFEIGVKHEFDENFGMNIALYHITKNNVALPDPADPFFALNSGEQQSDGVEVGLVGSPLAGWDLVANYAYTNAKITEGDPLGSFPEGNRLPNAPEHAFSLWNKYELQEGMLQGLGFGWGIQVFSQRQATVPNSVTLPTLVRNDLLFSYRGHTGPADWRVQLNILNIGDNKDFAVGQFNDIVPMQGRTFLGTLFIDL